MLGNISGRALLRVNAVAAPVALATLEAFHPLYEDDAFTELLPFADRWLVVHLAQLPLVALLALAVWSLASEVGGIASSVSRAAAVAFGLLYSAMDAVAGIATGMLAQYAASLPANEQPSVAKAIDELFTHALVGGGTSALTVAASGAWLVAVLAAAVALRQAGVHRVAVILLVLAAVLFPLGHTPPNAQLALGCFAAGAALAIRLPRRQISPQS